MNQTEPRATIPQINVEPSHPLPSFVFIDLRDHPEAWTQIENELPQDANPPVH